MNDAQVLGWLSWGAVAFLFGAAATLICVGVVTTAAAQVRKQRRCRDCETLEALYQQAQEQKRRLWAQYAELRDRLLTLGDTSTEDVEREGLGYGC